MEGVSRRTHATRDPRRQPSDGIAISEMVYNIADVPVELSFFFLQQQPRLGDVGMRAETQDRRPRTIRLLLLTTTTKGRVVHAETQDRRPRQIRLLLLTTTTKDRRMRADTQDRRPHRTRLLLLTTTTNAG